MDKILLSDTNQDAYMEVLAEPSDVSKPAVLIYPGGGYYGLSDCEITPIVKFYKENGFQPFVIRYSIAEKAHYPDPLIEGSKAVWEIRKNAKEYSVNSDQITLIGFSAGAHAATMLANLWHKDISRKGTDIPEGGNRPNATVTGYTPTTFEDFYVKFPGAMEKKVGDPESGPKNLLGEEGSGFEKFSSLTTIPLISELTPPAFLWKTTADFPESSFEYAMACQKYGVDYELHIFNDNGRCAAMEFDEERAIRFNPSYENNTKLWPEMSVNWLRRIYRL